MSFRIQHMAAGKYRLFQNGNDLGAEFDNLEDAKKGMARVIKPEIYEYDNEGRELKARK